MRPASYAPREGKNFQELRKELSSCSNGVEGKIFRFCSLLCVRSFSLIHFNSCLLRWLKSNLVRKFSFQFSAPIKRVFEVEQQKDLHTKRNETGVQNYAFARKDPYAPLVKIFPTLKYSSHISLCILMESLFLNEYSWLLILFSRKLEKRNVIAHNAQQLQKRFGEEWNWSRKQLVKANIPSRISAFIDCWLTR